MVPTVDRPEGNAHDVREGGQWSKRQRLKNDVLHALVVATLGMARLVSTPKLRALGRGLGRIVWWSVPALRRLAIANVARAFPDREPAERVDVARTSFCELGGLLGEAVGALDPRRPILPLPFAPGARACLDAAIAEGRGVVFASAHLGPWERVAATLALAGVPLTVVAREPYDPRLGAVYRRLRDGRGVRTLYRGKAGAGIGLVRVLRRGGVLGIPMDLASRVASIEVPFLDVLAPTPVGPARLALRTKAAVVVGTVAPLANGELGIAFCRLDPKPTERELSRQINEVLSERIRALPTLWPWMHRRWPDPSGRARAEP